jgi:hypothetical protein
MMLRRRRLERGWGSRIPRAVAIVPSRVGLAQTRVVAVSLDVAVVESITSSFSPLQLGGCSNLSGLPDTFL